MSEPPGPMGAGTGPAHQRAAVPGTDSLLAPSQRDDVDIRRALLRATTDLYVAKAGHSAAEEQQFTELALRLVDLVDDETREAVAHKLARYPDAPHTVLERLSQTAAAPPPATAEPEPGPRTAAQELDALFFAADSMERRLILIALDHSPIEPAAVPAASAETVLTLERAALGGDAEAFAKELERALAIPRAQARLIIEDESGEPVLAAGIALGMSEDMLQRVLLCLNPTIAQSVQRVYELASLHREIDPQAALRLIAIWQAAHEAEPAASRPPAHQPVSSRAAADPRPAAPPARPAIRWDEYATRKAEGA